MSDVYIYALACPVTEKIMYVGKSNNPHVRFEGHLSECRGSQRTEKSKWIRSLLNEGSKPLLKILETCPADVGNERERFWIRHHKLLNPSITNLSVANPRIHLSNAADLIPITIRIPPQVHEWIRTNAEKERRSLNSQIVLDLERLMKLDGFADSDGVIVDIR